MRYFNLFYGLLYITFMFVPHVHAQTIKTISFSENDVILDHENGYDVVRFEGCKQIDYATMIEWGSNYQAGKPSVPVKSITYILPQGVIAKSINVINVMRKRIDGEYLVKPSQPLFVFNKIS